MDNHQETFRFELDESLFFEKGQEVGEMTGISLDPNISIHPFNNYIDIRGVVELNGTYRHDASSQENDADIGFEDYHSKRYVENVVNLEDGLAEFSHRFPIEISVPAYRINDTEDVTVAIEFFDYEVPNKNQLKLTSTIEINGISEENGTYETDKKEDPALSLRGEETFAFDMKMDKAEQGETDFSTQPDDFSQSTNQSDEEESISETEREKNKKSQTLAEFFGTAQTENSGEETFASEGESSESSGEEPSLVGYTETAYQDDSSSSPEDVRYLADMFSRDEEETYAKMRLCIVQDSDTLESIAERYDTSAHQLLKQNRLAEEGVEEGQILYVPKKLNP